MSQPEISVVIRTFNEEKFLPDLLDALNLQSFQDFETIVVDSGSKDATLNIARSYGARAVNFEWNGRYPKKRNWLLTSETLASEWVLFLDADEFVDDAFCDAVAAAVENGNYDGYWLNYTNYFLGRRLRHGLPQRKLALFRVGKGLYEKIDEDGWSNLDMEIHEHPIVDGRVGEIRVAIDHHDYKGLSRFIERHCEYGRWEARRHAKLHESELAWDHFTLRQRFKYRHLAKWWYPWFYFGFTYFAKFGLLDGGAGFNYAFYKAWYYQTVRLLIREST